MLSTEDVQRNTKDKIRQSSHKTASLSLHHKKGNVKGTHFVEEYDSYSDDVSSTSSEASSGSAVDYFNDAHRRLFFLKKEECNDLNVENSDDVTVSSNAGSLTSGK